MDIKKYLVIICFLLLKLNGLAQEQVVDSLKAVVEKLNDDSTKVNALNELSTLLYTTHPDLAIMYSVEAMELGKRIKFYQGVALAIKYIGLGYYIKADFIKSIEYWNQSMDIYDSLGDKSGVSNILNNLGTVYYDQGDEATGVEYYLQAAKTAEEINDKLKMSNAYLNIGTAYANKTETYDMSKEYLSLAYKIFMEYEEYFAVGLSAVNLGEIYYLMDRYDSALYYYQKSLEAYELSEASAAPYTLNNIGKLYAKTGEYPSALKYHQDAFNLSLKYKDKAQQAQSLNAMGDVYLQMNNYKGAIKPYKEAEELAKEIGTPTELQVSYKGLAEAYSELRDFNNAFKYQNLLTEINHEIYNAENDKKIERMQFTYELDKREEEIHQLTTEKALQESEMKRQRAVIYGTLVGLVLIMAIAVIMYRNYREKARINKILDKQNAEIESLILNILPKEIARELQTEGQATPRYYENVSVLFTDFKGFSSISQGMTPNELVEHLNDYFHAFDDIIGRFGLEKIKTIGDAYMCAGGIPLPNKHHQYDIVKAGLAMQEYINQRKEELAEKGEVGWDLRVGIHTGPIVAGVVGKKKYAYDIWGNTVNIASRMESNGEPGKVNISSATYKLVRDHYKCHHRGKIYAKNVGDIDMYFIEEEIKVDRKFETVDA